jgi:hypothetical protein
VPDFQTTSVFSSTSIARSVKKAGGGAYMRHRSRRTPEGSSPAYSLSVPDRISVTECVRWSDEE